MKNSYAVVTGGNKGIGLEICRQLASEGVSVILTARNEKRGLEAVQQLPKSDGVAFHQLDVVDFASVDSLAGYLNSQFGKLDILVNNAGVNGVTDTENGGETEKSAYELAEKCLQINYYGMKTTTETLLPLLQKSNSPRIVNVSSRMGRLEAIGNQRARDTLSDIENLTEERIDEVVNEFLRDFKEGSADAKGWHSYWPAYCVSKAAVTAYTRLLAKKHPDILINSVAPGWVKTDLSRHTGPFTPQEGAMGPVRLALLPDGGPSGLFFDQMEVSPF